MIEEWRKVKGTPTVEVSSFGRVRSIGTKTYPAHIYKQTSSMWGYPRVHINVNGKNKNMTVHRLVAEAFIPNPENKPQINHIDGDKTNNNVKSLEWCTASENAKHREKVIWAGKHLGGKKNKKVLCAETGEVFRCVHDASEKVTGRRTNEVSKAIKTGGKCGNLHWKFIKPKEEQ